MHSDNEDASGDHARAKPELNVPEDYTPARGLTSRELRKEDEAGRLLDEWEKGQDYPDEPIDPVAQESLRRRIFAHARQLRDKREEWVRVFAYESAALHEIAGNPQHDVSGEARHGNDVEEEI